MVRLILVNVAMVLAAVRVAAFGIGTHSRRPQQQNQHTHQPAGIPSLSLAANVNINTNINAYQRHGSFGGASTSSSSRLHAISVKDMVNLDDSNYRDILSGEEEGEEKKAVLIDAYAPWCGPCKLLEPVLERAAAKWKNSVDVVRYDVESGNNSDLKKELLLTYGVSITSLPSLILFKDGEAVASRSGLVKDLELNIFLSSGLNKARQLAAAAAEEEEKEKEEIVQEEQKGTAESARGKVSLVLNATVC